MSKAKYMQFINPTIRRRVSALFAVAIIAGLAKPAAAEEVYMIRGFMDVFSNGMNQMTRTLNSRGIRAKAISNGEWRTVAEDIIRRKKSGRVSHPIIIVGHSLGGVEAPSFANTLGKAGIKTALVIGLDPGFNTPPPFGPGAVQVVNYKIPSGQSYRRGKGFKGRITTIDVSKYGADHVGIDKNPKVQSLVVKRIRQKVRK